MTKQTHWRITGPATYREGDGILMEIPIGPCEIVVTFHDATLSWVDGDTRGVATVPLGQFARWRAAGWLRAD